MKFIIGPCQLEDNDTPLLIADRLLALQTKLREEGHDVEFIFKACFAKPHRSKCDSSLGIPLAIAQDRFHELRYKIGLPICCDVHSAEHVRKLKKYIDYIQIPEVRSKDTALIKAAAKAKKPLVLKKGKFMSPGDILDALPKIQSVGHTQEIILTERGTTFGYNDLVVDMRVFQSWKDDIAWEMFNLSSCIDATHSMVGLGVRSCRNGGNPEMICRMALAGVAAGADIVFMEIHPNPKDAPCDGHLMLHEDHVETVVRKCLALKEALDG